MRKTHLLLMWLTFMLTVGCHQQNISKPNKQGYSVWDIISITEERAPAGLKGDFELYIKNTGKQNRRIYLNTEEDYRDRRNITVTLLPEYLKAFRELYDMSPRNYFKNQTVLVKGEAKRVKIWFFKNGKRSNTYYFQTHIVVSDLNQIIRLDQPKEVYSL